MATKTVLIVDDSRSLRQVVAIALSAAGYQTVEAENGIEAIKVASGTKFDVIITDVNMPGMDGIELTRKLRAQSANRFTPIIVLTTESEKAKIEEGRAAGAKAWLIKPFRPEHVVSAVEKLAGITR